MRNSQNYFNLPFNPKLKKRAKELRKAGNLAEVLFWQQVKNKSFKGMDFDRQKIIGNYIVDFYCPNCQVVIEIDGSSHKNKQEYDTVRDEYLKGLGLEVIHITDIDVKKNIDSVMRFLDEHPAFSRDRLKDTNMDHPAFQAPLQGRGTGYKSSGGKMVYNEELDKEIPEGWELTKLVDVLECNPETLSNNDNFKNILYLDTSNITNNRINELQELDLEKDEIPSRARRKVKDNDIIFSTVRPALKHYGIIKNLPENLIVSTGFAVFRVKELNLFPELLYSFLTDEKTVNFLQAKAEMSVSTYPSVTSDDILNLEFTKPNDKMLDIARDIFKSKDDFINLKNKENQKLSELKNLLLSKLATIEN